MPSRRALLAAVSASPLALSACGTSKPSTKRSNRLTKVNYLTGFQDTPREQYSRVAVAKGFFREVGLEVTIQPGQPADFNFIQLETGKMQFASADFVSAVKYLVGGKYHYQIVGVIQQKTLLGLSSLESEHIQTPADLNGKSIGTAAGGAVESLFPVYAKLAGVNPKIDWKHVPPDQIGQLLGAGKVDAIGTYICDTPNTEAAVGGRTLNVLAYEHYLSDLLGTVVVASGQVIAQQPALVSRFAQAIVNGTVYACNNPDETGQIIQKALPAIKPGPAAGVYRLMQPYVTRQNTPAGVLDQMHVMKGISVLESGGIIPQGSITPTQLCAFDLAPKAA